MNEIDEIDPFAIQGEYLNIHFRLLSLYQSNKIVKFLE